jgi:hypothetical protein
MVGLKFGRCKRWDAADYVPRYNVKHYHRYALDA